jgi:Zn-dependent M28 family amino/carboxypeptidase
VLRTIIKRRRTELITLGSAVALATAVIASPGGAAAGSVPDDGTRLATKLVEEVKLNAVNRHLVALQRLADQNNKTRASGTPGYEASAKYVADRLTDAGYNVQIQEFQFDFEQTLAESASVVTPAPRTLNPRVMRYSPNTPVGGVTAPISTVPGLPGDTSPGCELSDFTGTYTGTIVVIQRGSCPFQQKHDNAVAKGAVGVLVYNNTADPNEIVAGRLTDATTGRIPIGGLSRAEGEALVADLARGTVTVRLELRVLKERRASRNVIAETRTGRSDNVVMSGAHLDSVLAGPGINDNGTGSAAQLELALQLADEPVRNKVRFAWWGAEESGLVGSTYYVSQLSFEEQLNIAMYLNYDMIGSPNFARFIYDGDDSDNTGAPAGPTGSGPIEDVFEAYFTGRGLTHEGTDFTGRSDYGPFIAVAIPAGGLFTGAEGRKTAEQAARYGGTAGQPYDACYHQACDTLFNVNRTVLDQNADAMAWATGLFAIDTSAVNGNASTLAKQQRRAAALRSMTKNSVRSSALGEDRIVRTDATGAVVDAHAHCGHVTV